MESAGRHVCGHQYFQLALFDAVDDGKPLFLGKVAHDVFGVVAVQLEPFRQLYGHILGIAEDDGVGGLFAFENTEQELHFFSI